MRTTEQPSGFLRLFYKTTKISAILISVVLIVSLSSNSYFLNYHACSTGPPVDECTLGLHDCDSKANSSCVDTRFYYKCECNPGFRETDDSQCEGVCIRIHITCRSILSQNSLSNDQILTYVCLVFNSMFS